MSPYAERLDITRSARSNSPIPIPSGGRRKKHEFLSKVKSRSQTKNKKKKSSKKKKKTGKFRGIPGYYGSFRDTGSADQEDTPKKSSLLSFLIKDIKRKNI